MREVLDIWGSSNKHPQSLEQVFPLFYNAAGKFSSDANKLIFQNERRGLDNSNVTVVTGNNHL